MKPTTFSRKTSTPAETEEIAGQMARLVAPGEIVGLQGDLGSGKTCFTRGFVAGLQGGDAVHVSSPTFALLNVYRTAPPVFHFDLYRVSGVDDLETTGFWDIISDGEGIAVLEWCDRLTEVLETVTWHVSLSSVDEQKRELSICGPHGAIATLESRLGQMGG